MEMNTHGEVAVRLEDTEQGEILTFITPTLRIFLEKSARRLSGMEKVVMLTVIARWRSVAVRIVNCCSRDRVLADFKVIPRSLHARPIVCLVVCVVYVNICLYIALVNLRYA